MFKFMAGALAGKKEAKEVYPFQSIQFTTLCSTAADSLPPTIASPQFFVLFRHRI
jgi:hypothetical protein